MGCNVTKLTDCNELDYCFRLEKQCFFMKRVCRTLSIRSVPFACKALCVLAVRREHGCMAVLHAGGRKRVILFTRSAGGAYPDSFERTVGVAGEAVETGLGLCHAVVAFDVEASLALFFIDSDGFGYA